MCEERKWKKDIHIQLANMKYTDSCIEILQLHRNSAKF